MLWCANSATLEGGEAIEAVPEPWVSVNVNLCLCTLFTYTEDESKTIFDADEDEDLLFKWNNPENVHSALFTRDKQLLLFSATYSLFLCWNQVESTMIGVVTDKLGDAIALHMSLRL